MTVPYKLMKTGGKLPNNKELRVVVDEYETVGLERIGARVEKTTAMTIADLVGTLEALKYEVAEQLKLGNRVYLPGLGYFSLAVRGELYEDPKSHKVRLRNPQVRTVKFRPEKGLMKMLGDTQFENATYRAQQHDMPTEENIAAALDRLFADSSCIIVNDLRAELRISGSMAYRLATRLEKEGKLCNIGTRYRKMFVRG